MLYGREAELGRVDELLARAGEGRGGALAVTGWAGIGKTTLLGAVADGANARVLATTGLEAESSLPYSALAELADGLLDGVRELPPPQAAALESALALGPPAPGDRFAVYTGFLGLLGAAAEERPLLVIVDDAHWLDRGSADCLAFAARRLDDKPVAMLVAARSDEPHAFGGRGIDQLPLGGLDDAAARTLLSQRDGELRPAVAESLIEAAAGNPLALLELPGLLTDEQRAGSAPLDKPLPPGISLQRAFERRIGRLPEPEREALLDLRDVLHARARADSSPPAMSSVSRPARSSAPRPPGSSSSRPERIEFDHPLLRGAVYQGAPAAERRRAHRALAAHTDADARAWHLAAAALGEDAEAADALEAAGFRAAARGAHAAASEALERSARLTSDREARSRRIFATGLEAALGGAFDRGESLLELVTEIEDPVLRAHARRLQAMVTLNAGSRPALANHELLTEEAEAMASLDPTVAATLHSDAAVTAAVGGACALMLESAERGAELLPAVPTRPRAARCSRCWEWVSPSTARVAEAREALDEAGRLLPEVEPLSPAAQSISLGLGARLSTGQEAAAARGDRPRGGGARGADPGAARLLRPARRRLRLPRRGPGVGRPDIAESVAIAEESGQGGPLSIGLVIAARAHAAARPRGGGPGRGGARDRARRARRLRQHDRVGPRRARVLRARARPGRRCDRGARADRATRPGCAASRSPPRSRGSPTSSRPTAARAAPTTPSACHAPSRNAPGLAAPRSRRHSRPAARASSPRDGFDEAFERALAFHAEAAVPVRARPHPARLRLEAPSRAPPGRRARAAARSSETFAGLGARPWEMRAEAELNAAGAIERNGSTTPTSSPRRSSASRSPSPAAPPTARSPPSST